MIKVKAGKCETCYALSRVYRKHINRYKRENVYYCTKRDCIIDVGGGCEMWQEKSAPDLSAQRFDQVQNDIAVISEILIAIE